MISRYCIIRNQNIVIDGNSVFAEKSDDLSDFLVKAYAALRIDYPKFYKMDNLSKLGFLAAELLLSDKASTQEYAPDSISLVLSNAHASMDTDLRYAESAKTLASPALFVYTLSNIVAGEICIRHKIKGENAFFVSEAFDPELLTTYVEMVLSPNGRELSPRLCVAGWVDILGEHHDVFLYLYDKNKPGPWPHTARQVKELYNTPIWNN